jgi:hypothetical protein
MKIAYGEIKSSAHFLDLHSSSPPYVYLLVYLNQVKPFGGAEFRIHFEAVIFWNTAGLHQLRIIHLKNYPQNIHKPNEIWIHEPSLWTIEKHVTLLPVSVCDLLFNSS